MSIENVLSIVFPAVLEIIFMVIIFLKYNSRVENRDGLLIASTMSVMFMGMMALMCVHQVFSGDYIGLVVCLGLIVIAFGMPFVVIGKLSKDGGKNGKE